MAVEVRRLVDAGQLTAPVRLKLRFVDAGAFVDADGSKSTFDVSGYINDSSAVIRLSPTSTSGLTTGC